MTTTVESSIECDVPISVAYNQWTQFATFPEFMHSVESVTQLTAKDMHWKAKIFGVQREWDATITEQVPEERIAWTATDGTQNAGCVTFHKISDTTTKVMLQLDFDPHGIVEQVGDKLGIVSDQAEGDLKNFKKFIESQGSETGAWRGEIDRDSGSVSADSADSTYPTESTLTSSAGLGGIGDSPAVATGLGEDYPSHDDAKTNAQFAGTPVGYNADPASSI